MAADSLARSEASDLKIQQEDEKMKVEVLFLPGYAHGGESVDDRPHIRLRSWRVAELNAGTQHFIGFDIDAHEGRVSTSIKQFDRKARKGITESGRIYEVIGRPGRDPDADYIWDLWKRVNGGGKEKNVMSSYLAIPNE